MPQGVVLDDELRSDRRAEAQREWRCLVEFVIGERSNRAGRITAVFAQQLKRGGLGNPSMFLGVLGIQPGDNLPGNVCDGLAAGDGASIIDDEKHQTLTWTDEDGAVRQGTLPMVVFCRPAAASGRTGKRG